MASLSAGNLHRSALARFGEPVQFGGREERAIVLTHAQPTEIAQANRSGRGGLPLRHQRVEALLMNTADAVDLKEQDEITVRGDLLLVIRLDADGQGFTRVELMLPGPETGEAPEQRPWR